MLRAASSCQVNIYKHSRCSLGNTSPTDTPGGHPPMLSPTLLQPQSLWGRMGPAEAGSPGTTEHHRRPTGREWRSEEAEALCPPEERAHSGPGPRPAPSRGFGGVGWLGGPCPQRT